jgi:hypothetical protein
MFSWLYLRSSIIFDRQSTAIIRLSGLYRHKSKWLISGWHSGWWILILLIPACVISVDTIREVVFRLSENPLKQLISWFWRCWTYTLWSFPRSFLVITDFKIMPRLCKWRYLFDIWTLVIRLLCYRVARDSSRIGAARWVHWFDCRCPFGSHLMLKLIARW